MNGRSRWAGVLITLARAAGLLALVCGTAAAAAPRAGRTESTLASLLPRFHDVTEGTVTLGGDGRVTEQGRHDELLAAQGRYASLWEAQRSARPDPADAAPGRPPAPAGADRAADDIREGSARAFKSFGRGRKAHERFVGATEGFADFFSGWVRGAQGAARAGRGTAPGFPSGARLVGGARRQQAGPHRRSRGSGRTATEEGTAVELVWTCFSLTFC